LGGFYLLCSIPPSLGFSMQTRWHPSHSDQAWLAEALTMRGEFHLVLAGGNTPRTVYRALAREAHDWPRWHIWFGDEPCLPPNHPERNSAMARAAALAYAEELARVPAFDLVLLDLGEDGNSAS